MSKRNSKSQMSKWQMKVRHSTGFDLRFAHLPFAISIGVFAAGCSNPLGPMDADYRPTAPLGRIKNVEPLDRDKYAAPTVPVTSTSPTTPGAPHVSRFAGLATTALTLEEARRAVLENNLDLKVALVDPTIQTQALREQEAKFEAVFKPFVNYADVNNPTLDVTTPNNQKVTNYGAGVDVPLRTGGRVSVDYTESINETPNPFFLLDKSYESALTFSLSQPLLRNAGRRASTYTIRIAAIDTDIAMARTKLEVIRQIAAADRAYWRLYAAQQALEVRQKQYEVAVAQLERARRRVAAGDAPELEVTRAEAGAASQLDSIIQAEKLVLDTQREVKRLLNIPDLGVGSPTLIMPATPPDPVRFEFVDSELAAQGVANRMEMLELELRLAQDFSTIEFNKNQALPLFTLDFAYSIPGLGATRTDAWDQLGSASYSNWNVGVGGQIPIGNEAAKARVQQAILIRLQRLSTKDARAQAIRSEVFGSVDAIDAAWQRIMASRQAVILAAKTLEGEQRQFDAGARTSTDVLDAAARLADEQTNEVRALAEYQIAQVDLAFATGTLVGASKVDWSPSDPRTTAPAGGDPTPYAFPLYPDPAKATGPLETWEREQAEESKRKLQP